MEWFLIECHKTKTKAITMAIKRKQRNEPMRELEANRCNGCQAWENVCDQVLIGFGFTFDWLSKWRKFFFIANHRA